jgi:hypothetical protein
VAEISWDLPSLAIGVTAPLDVIAPGACVGDLAQASLATSSWFFELDAIAWSDNAVACWRACILHHHRPHGGDALRAGDEAKGAVELQNTRPVIICSV